MSLDGWVDELALYEIQRAFRSSFPKKSVVAFSGGKDSVVVLDLVRRINPEIKAVFCNTGVEHPDTVKFCRSINNIVELSPMGNFWELVDKYGFPMSKAVAKDGNKCCVYLKEKPAEKYYKENDIGLVFTGLTMAESRNRMMLLKSRGLTYFAKSQKRWKCHPIGGWSEDEVWEYIKDRGLSYNPIYDKGAKRCGCVPCTAYLSWKKRLAKENPKMLKLILQKQGQFQITDYCSPAYCGGQK